MNCAVSKPKRVGIIQSNYIPWKGYFDFIDAVDEFVLLDDVQFTRRDWRNRNKIKTKNGLQWLTVPVEVKGKYFQSIDQTRIADPRWVDEHLSALRHCYGRAPHFRDAWPWVEDLYRGCSPLEYLSQVNARLIRGIADRLKIATPIRTSREFRLVEGKNERLIEICRQAGGSEYLSGPAARDYIDQDVWNAAGISVKFKSYAGYPEYPQINGDFEHGVTVLDLIFNTGEKSRTYLKSAADVEPALV